MKIFRRDLSVYTIIFCVFIISVFIFTSRVWKRENSVIYWDVVSYYAYLPATFIFNDIRLEKKESYENGIFWPDTAPNGGKVIKTTMGLSFLYAPFFFAGHIYANVFDYQTNGFSVPYKLALLIGALFYLTVAMIFMRKVLKKFFPDIVVALTIIAIVLGTNLAYYSSREGAMSHLYSFTLFSVFVWLTIRWHEEHKLLLLLLSGALAGLISLIRPTNILILIFFLLYDVSSWKTFVQKIRFIIRHFHWFIFMFIAFVIIWIPQLIYWKEITGHFLYYSYHTESFFFNNPQILNGLFSYRKGWLLYTPIMAIALAGIPLLFFKMKNISFAVLVFVAVNIYVVFSWWCWWYGGGFGQRPMIDSYIIFSFPFALVLDQSKKAGKYFFAGVATIVFILLLHNIFQLEKYKYGSIHFDSMTREAYKRSFFRLHPPDGFYDVIKAPDYEKAVKGIEEYP
jgi:hypothetical protein